MSREPIQPVTYWQVEADRAERVDGHIVAESPLCIHVNGQEWVTLLCSPHAVEDLVIGFLYLEGLIRGLEDIALLARAENEHCVDVWLKRAVTSLPHKVVITSGCGGGLTFDEVVSQLPRVDIPLTIAPRTLSERMHDLQQAAQAYRAARGIHSSALSDGERLLCVAEDVGRHNTVDRVCGQALRQGLSTEGKILLTTGRISSEMARKAAKMRIPLVASRTSPTGLAVRLAERWGITLVGYVRRHGLRVYTHPERLGIRAAAAGVML